MVAAALPVLQTVSNPEMMLTVDAANFEPLVFKSGSMVYAHMRESHSSVLKRVNSPESFERELKAMSAISDHLNVAKLLAFDGVGQYLLIDPLGDRDISQPDFVERVSPGELYRMFVHLLAGLEHVHQQGWIHRDIRPENIIFCKAASKLVLIDFGLAVPGPTYSSPYFSGFVKFAAEEHLRQMCKNPNGGPFQWSAVMDRKALFRVALYVGGGARRGLDDLYEQYMTAEATQRPKFFESFTRFREEVFNESRLDSLAVALPLSRFFVLNSVDDVALLQPLFSCQEETKDEH